MNAAKQAGDTIIEVMISMSILAVILGVSFASATRSLNQGTNANNRNSAIQFAEQQITSIQNLVQTSASPPTFPAGNFCMNGTTIDQTTSDCDQPPFSVSDSFNSTTHTFTITCTWQGLNNQQEQTQLYYHTLNAAGS